MYLPALYCSRVFLWQWKFLPSPTRLIWKFLLPSPTILMSVVALSLDTFSSQVLKRRGNARGGCRARQCQSQEELESPQPSQISEILSKTHGFLNQIDGFPIKTDRFPIKINGFPIQTYGFPIKTNGFPIQINGCPIKTYRFLI